MVGEKYKRHWSFIVCDERYLYPFISVILLVGIYAAFALEDPTQMNRVGNFIVAIGVWMSMRFVLREGMNKHKNAQDSMPVIPGPGKAKQLNANYFNNITFSIGDAKLQFRGFIIVLMGSTIGSYGDIIFTNLIK